MYLTAVWHTITLMMVGTYLQSLQQGLSALLQFRTVLLSEMATLNLGKDTEIVTEMALSSAVQE